MMNALAPHAPMPTEPHNDSLPHAPAYLAVLNGEQRRAVEAVDGPVLVLAGAGTGKTRVLTTRIAHILQQRKAMPGQILAVTFTNKAAREMSHRVEQLLGYSSVAPDGTRMGSPLQWLGTFHSIGMKMLRRHAEKLGFTSSFTILDADDQMRLLKAIMIERNIDVKQHTPKSYMGVIQSMKDQGLTPDAATTHARAKADELTLPLYRAYQERLKTINAMDFGDLLLHCLTIFQQYPDVATQFAQQFHYILVDEYQDTNVAQYLWLRVLALGHKNICCVGDDDQSIYGWRGAEVGNILRFESDFPNATVVRLEQNYRSTSNILAAAGGVIGNNRTRLGKKLWTESDGGEKVRLRCTHDSDEEALYIGEEIEAAQREGFSLAEVAILVRASFQTRSFEERFLTLGLPYKVIGGLRFYERQEIRDAIAYLRVIAEPRDDLALERIINLPKRGVGKATMELMHSTARNMHISLHAAVEHLHRTGQIKGKLGQTMKDLLDQFTLWQQNAAHLPLNELAEKVILESGYQAMWEAEKSVEAQGRLENLRELTRAMGEFESLTSFLEHVGLVTDEASATQHTDMISIMTLHAAKGLEFDVVFLPGWEEGLFPHQRALDESGSSGLEEERRLAYVGITRAKKRLTITRAERRRFFANGGIEWQTTLPSRFLKELPQANVEDLGGGIYGGWGAQRRNAMQDEMKNLFAAHSTGANIGWGKTGAASSGSTLTGAALAEAKKQYSASSFSTKAEDNEIAKVSYAVGERVFHQKFGYGRVISKDGANLEIAFEKASTKKVMSDYVKRA
jgi:DNA helicase-2/ATP-dependent DNA helicase PcrA